MSHYKIYFSDKPFIITNKLEPENEKLAATHGTIMLNHYDQASLLQATYSLENTPAQAVIVLTDKTEEAFTLFRTFFTDVQTGGGLIENERGEYLFIYRRKKWDLPKGKLDDGETIEQCALREVREETGLSNVKIENFITHTWHCYPERGKRILKRGSWYNMRATTAEKLVPQLEEDIEEIIWLPKAKWAFILQNTFQSIKDVLAKDGQ